MGVTIEVRRPGKDGRLVLVHMRSDQEKWRLIRLVHQSRCELHLSYRATQRRIEQYGARLSLGWVYAYARDYECDICAGQPAQTAQEQPTEPARVHQAQASGSLTGMISDG